MLEFSISFFSSFPGDFTIYRMDAVPEILFLYGFPNVALRLSSWLNSLGNKLKWASFFCQKVCAFNFQLSLQDLFYSCCQHFQLCFVGQSVITNIILSPYDLQNLSFDSISVCHMLLCGQQLSMICGRSMLWCNTSI